MRIDPPKDASETVQLTGFLTYQRDTMLLKTEGLAREQLGRRLPSSSLTLAGLVHHLALVEESWAVERFAGQPSPEPWAGIDWEATPDWEFDRALDLDPEELRERYRLACRRTDEVVAATGDLDALSVPLPDGQRFSLRWMLLHLLEETSRHNGHADLLREAIDGATGE
ncbi:DinB family protein [Blastococcus sp. URHD0036]|uniref:DinB family protein n=1 Tax=Blastococcus sp. URHD0036 TaxID=1380356 RepID=UPI0018CC666A|nr:DinB family protein [Blastococcus sp. URHD0036]